MVVIGSKRIHIREVEYYEIFLRAGYSVEELKLAEAELKQLRKMFGYDDSVSIRKSEDSRGVTLWFEGATKVSGMDLNPLTDPEVSWVEDHL